MADQLFDVIGVSVGLGETIAAPEKEPFVLVAFSCGQSDVALRPSYARVLARQLNDMADLIDRMNNGIGSVK